jgi:hypothetical protein
MSGVHRFLSRREKKHTTAKAVHHAPERVCILPFPQDTLRIHHEVIPEQSCYYMLANAQRECDRRQP